MPALAGRQVGWVVIVVWVACMALAGRARAQLGLDVSPPVPVENDPPPVPREARSHGLATDGNKWLVVYAPHLPDFPLPDTNKGSLVGSLVDAEGVPLVPSFQLAETGRVYDLSVAFDGTSFLIVWVDELSNLGASNNNVRYMRVSSDGTVTSPPAVLETTTGIGTPIAVSAGETGVLVVVGAYDGCHIWVVTGDAVNRGDTVRSAQYCVPYAGFSDGTWLLAYTGPSGSVSGTSLAQIAGDGALVPGTAQTVPPTVFSDLHSIAPAANGFVVAREDGQNVELIEVGFDGSAALAELVIEDLAGWPSLIAHDEGYALFYLDVPCEDCFYAGMVQTVTPALELESPEPLQLGDGTNFEPAPARDGQAAFVTWLGKYAELRAASLTFTESTAFGQANVISTASANQSLPQVAVGNDGWFVAWEEARIPFDGRAPPYGIRAVRLDTLGNPLGEPITVVSTTSHRELIEVAHGPGGWLLASIDSTFGYVERVSDDSTVSRIALPSSTIQVPMGLHLVGSPAGWLVAWQDSDLSITAARIEPDGSVKDWVVLGATAEATRAPIRSTYHDGDYIVLWRDDDGDVSTVTLPTTAPLPTPVSRKLVDVNGFSSEFDVAFGDHNWWAWMNVNNARSFRTSGGLVFGLAQGAPVLPLVAVDGLALTATWSSYQYGIELSLAPPEGNLIALQRIPGWARGDLSEAVDNQVLMATSEALWVEGHLTERVRTRLLTVSGGVPSGGAGGIGGAEIGEGGASGSTARAGAGGVGSHGGGSASQPAGGEGGITGQPHTGDGGNSGQPMGDAGSPNEAHGGGAQLEPSGGRDSHMPGAGGVPAGGMAAIPEGEQHPSRESNGCGCRTAGASNGVQPFGASLVLLLTMLSRRSKRSKRSKHSKPDVLGCARSPVHAAGVRTDNHEPRVRGS